MPTQERITMTIPNDPEWTRLIQAVLKAHTDAFHALSRANASMALAIQAAHSDAFVTLRRVNASMGEAIQAHDDAIKAALRANQAAIDLLNAYEHDHATKVRDSDEDPNGGGPA
jgi:hypothetical protein